MLPGGGSLSQAERPETVEPSSHGSAGDTWGCLFCCHMFLGVEQEGREVEDQLIKGIWRNKQNDLGGYQHRA